MKKDRKKYATGTSVKDYLENPSDVLQQNKIDIAKADYEASTNSWVLGMSAAGNLAMNYGIEKGGFGESAEGQIANELAPMLANMEFAMGGKVPGVPVEVEGDEVAETPEGELLKFKGPSHEQGGIDVDLPAATEVFSKRIKIGGKTMAERKMTREKREAKLRKLLEESPSDGILKSSSERTKEVNAKEEAIDKKIQEAISQSLNTFAFGGKVPGDNPFDVPEGIIGSAPDRIDISPTLGVKEVKPKTDAGFDATFGDSVGLLGNLISTFGPMMNTMKSRSEDTPNVNYFKDFGEEGLAKIDETKGFVEQQKDEALKDLQLGKTAAIKRGRNSARGVNTARALDLATEQSANQSETNIYSTFANQMMQILGQESQLENQQDQMVMSGEREKDIANRQDTDVYYTNRGKDISTMGTGLQETGKDVNAIKREQVLMNLLSELSNYGLEFDSSGNLIESE